MPSSIRPNDILWTRNGDPTLVKKLNDKTGEVNLEESFPTVQSATKNGIKNGLSIEQREAYKSTLSGVANTDKKKEIQELYNKIKSLKESNTDHKLLRYLDSELQFRMIREEYKPNDFSIDPTLLDI